MLPLIFCWYWNIWKAQGQTIRGKGSLHLGRGEKEHGLSHVAMSCVTRFYDIGLYEGITYSRLGKLIRKHKVMTPRINAEQRFRTLFTRTQVFLHNLLKINIIIIIIRNEY